MTPSKYIVRGRHKPETVGKSRCIHIHHFHIWKGFGCVLIINHDYMSSVEPITDSYPPVVSGYINGGVGNSFLWA